MAWLSGWSYRKEISITGQSGAGTDYQVQFDIGDSAGGDFHLEGHCTNFPQDIEVTDNDGTTLLKFWIADIAADPLELTVKVADDLGTNQTIYIYYGKSGATTNSSGSDTFIEFFDGNSSGWTEVDQGADILFTNDRLEFTNLPRNLDGYVYKSFARASDNLTFEYAWNVTTNNSGQIVFLPSMANSVDDLRNQQNHYSTGYVVNAGINSKIEISDSTYIGSAVAFTPNTTYYNIATRVGNTITVKIYTDTARTNLLGTTTVTQATIPSLSYLFLLSNYNSGDPNAISGWLDNFFIREYLATEPAFSSAGSEETPPTGVSPTGVFYGPLVGPLGGPL